MCPAIARALYPATSVACIPGSFHGLCSELQAGTLTIGMYAGQLRAAKEQDIRLARALGTLSKLHGVAACKVHLGTVMRRIEITNEELASLPAADATPAPAPAPAPAVDDIDDDDDALASVMGDAHAMEDDELMGMELPSVPDTLPGGVAAEDFDATEVEARLAALGALASVAESTATREAELEAEITQADADAAAAIKAVPQDRLGAMQAMDRMDKAKKELKLLRGAGGGGGAKRAAAAPKPAPAPAKRAAPPKAAAAPKPSLSKEQMEAEYSELVAKCNVLKGKIGLARPEYQL